MKHALLQHKDAGAAAAPAAEGAAAAAGAVTEDDKGLRFSRKDRSLFCGFELKSVDDAERTFEGMAAAFTQDLGGDVILPGAFKRTIADWKRSKRVLPLLDTHNMGGTVLAVIGKVLDAKETDEGVWSKSQIIEGQIGDEVFRRVKGGFVDGLSIGYRPVQIKAPTEDEQRRGIWRFLKEVAWKELSVCLYPMNTDARIDIGTVKHLLAKAEDRTLDPDELAELQLVDVQIRALLAKSAPAPDTQVAAPAETGLAPDDPARLAIADKVRGIKLRSLRAL